MAYRAKGRFNGIAYLSTTQVNYIMLIHGVVFPVLIFTFSNLELTGYAAFFQPADTPDAVITRLFQWLASPH
jgi:hypothetical protein